MAAFVRGRKNSDRRSVLRVPMPTWIVTRIGCIRGSLPQSTWHPRGPYDGNSNGISQTPSPHVGLVHAPLTWESRPNTAATTRQQRPLPTKQALALLDITAGWRLLLFVVSLSQCRNRFVATHHATDPFHYVVLVCEFLLLGKRHLHRWHRLRDNSHALTRWLCSRKRVSSIK